MITAKNAKQAAFVSAEDPSPKCIFEFAGLSSDAKPSVFEGAAVANGSTFLEMDTSSVFIYDKDGDTWREL